MQYHNPPLVEQSDYLDYTPPALADLIITSPEYPGLRGSKRAPNAWLRWWEGVARKAFFDSAENAVFCVNVDFPLIDGYEVDLLAINRFQAVTAFWWKCIGIHAWVKPNPAPNGAIRNPRSDRKAWEPIYVFAKSADYTYNPQRTPYATKTRQKAASGNMRAAGVNGAYAGGNSRLHPDGALPVDVRRVSSSADGKRPRVSGGSFPRALPRHFIKTYSNPGDLVMDPFAGAGTTGFEALEHGRLFCGCDISADAVATANGWLATAKTPLPTVGQVWRRCV